MYNYIHLVFIFASILCAYGETDCDRFSYGSLCYLTPNDIIDIFPSPSTEIECQEQCKQTTDCNFFTFAKFDDGHSTCFMFKSCTDSFLCSSHKECTMSVSGPVAPAITKACCTDFERKTCPLKYAMDEILNVHGEEMCQNLCRDVKGCTYWTLMGDVCFLYSRCDEAEACDICTSGPAFPDISTCSSHRVEHTLVMGGYTTSENYATSVELITSNVVCTPDMPPLPVKRRYSSAVILGSKIYYCGGEGDSGNLNIHGTCHSYRLGQGSVAWMEEPSMVFGRYEFGLTAIGNKIYATGGLGEFDIGTSVESYTMGGQWELREDMTMPRARHYHCSVALGSRLFVIGGDDISYVEAFDTDNPEAGWKLLANMNENHYRHACLVGELDGQAGIFVSGDHSTGSAVEFYFDAANHWLTLESLRTGRSAHTMTMVNGQMIVAGGYPSGLTSVETLNGTQWIETNNLKVGRMYHAAVSVPSGYLQCKLNSIHK